MSETPNSLATTCRMMRWRSAGGFAASAGTDFTVLVCLELLVYFLGGAVSGFLAKGLGYSTYYLLLGGLSVHSVLLSRWVIARLEAAFRHS